MMQLIATGAAGVFYAIAQRQRISHAVRSLWGRLRGGAIAPALPADDGPYWRDGCIVTHQWVSNLNEKPDSFPHLFVVGPSGSGKTTFTTALLTTREGRIAVFTPKPDDEWGGLAVLTIDDDASFTTVQKGFAALHTEVKRRLVCAKRREPVGEPLTVVFDDAPALLSEGGKEAVAVLKLIARLGRSFRIRLILLSQSERVKSLGLEGEGDALDNFTRVVLQAGHKGATWYVRGIELPLELTEVPTRARVSLQARCWGDVAALLTASSAPPAAGIVTSAEAASNERNEPVTACTSDVTSLLPVTVTSAEAAKIADLLGRYSPSEVAKKLDGYTPKRYAEYKAKVDAVIVLLRTEDRDG